jgi:hypothetical protein
MKFTAFSSLICVLISGQGSGQDTSFYPSYTQLSSTETQINGAIGAGIDITYDSIDAVLGVSFASGDSQIGITSQSAYFALAAPQVGAVNTGSSQIADYFMKLNSADVGNSNVRYSGDGTHEDVIVCQGVLDFFPGDSFSIAGSGVNSQTEAITEAGEPLVPSIIYSMFELPLPVYAQLSSTETQVNGPLGTGSAITYDSIDALAGIDFSGGSEITIKEDGAYFIIAAPQVGSVDSGEEQIADYWVKVNGESVSNSNVRYTGHGDMEDVIICQGVYELSAGDVVEVYGSGKNSATEAISPAGEPLVPAIIFSMFKLSDSAPYAQLSSSTTQANGPLGSGVAISFNSVDALYGLKFETKFNDQIVIESAGAYFIVAAPQVGAIDTSSSQIADYWVRVNGEDVGNSNVRYSNDGDHEDVIVCQGVYELQAGDKVQVIGSGVNSATEAIEQPGEPLVPSIIFSMFKL